MTAFLDGVPDERRRAEGHTMRDLIERVTSAPAEMWGPSIVGFGRYTYVITADQGDEEFLAETAKIVQNAAPRD